MLVALTAVGLGVTLRLSTPGTWYVLLAVCLLVFWGTGLIIASRPSEYVEKRHSALAFSILPAVLVLASGVLLQKTALLYWQQALGVIVAILLLAGTIWSEYHTVMRKDRGYNNATFLLNVVAYISAFATYAALYFYFRLPGYQEALTVGLLSTLLATDLLRHPQHEMARIWMYSAVTGLVLGEIQLALKYLSTEGIAGAIFLLLMFYLITGIIQSNFAGRLSRARVAEYALVTLAGFALLFSSRLWAG